jgi:hypothetical protein
VKFRLEGLKDLKSLVKELSLGLRKLTFGSNFDGFTKEVTISATSELAIRNELTYIPNYFIILSQEGNGLITKGTSTWDSNYIYLYNNGAVSVTATVLFTK